MFDASLQRTILTTVVFQADYFHFLLSRYLTRVIVAAVINDKDVTPTSFPQALDNPVEFLALVVGRNQNADSHLCGVRLLA